MPSSVEPSETASVLGQSTPSGIVPTCPLRIVAHVSAIRAAADAAHDPKFEEKFWDVIGLYLDPPAKALVLCCDEKSQCQALERTQLGLPLVPKRTRRMTHDYTRHGTITLFAALVQLTGKLIARTEASHTHIEWLRFLKQIDRETPPALDLHLIADNYARTNIQRCGRGCTSIRASKCTSRRPLRPGSIWSGLLIAINPTTAMNIPAILLAAGVPPEQLPEVRQASREAAIQAVSSGIAIAAIMDQPA